jgi:hypothetical protein
MPNPPLDIRTLTFETDRHAILDGLDLTVRPAEIHRSSTTRTLRTSWRSAIGSSAGERFRACGWTWRRFRTPWSESWSSTQACTSINRSTCVSAWRTPPASSRSGSTSRCAKAQAEITSISEARAKGARAQRRTGRRNDRERNSALARDVRHSLTFASAPAALTVRPGAHAPRRGHSVGVPSWAYVLSRCCWQTRQRFAVG